jgi:Tol biopolymer transport system component
MNLNRVHKFIFSATLIAFLVILVACRPDKQSGATPSLPPTLSPPGVLATPQPVPSRTATPLPAGLTPTQISTVTPFSLATSTSTPSQVPKLPAQGSIAFINRSHGRTDGVYVIRFPDATPKWITSNIQSGFSFKSPSWSPDGKWIAFASDYADTTIFGQFDIYVIGADGENMRRITYGGYSWDPAWSPDGEWIAYVANQGIFRMHPDGSGTEALTFDGGIRGLPAWSPDGRYLAYIYSDANPKNNYRLDIIVLEIKTGHTYTVVKDVTREPSMISWSMDSRLIYFHQGKDCGRLFAVENKEGASPTPVVIENGNLRSLSWSPDGKWVTYVLLDNLEDKICRQRNTQLFVASVDGTAPVLLAKNPDFDPMQAVWAPANKIP